MLVSHTKLGINEEPRVVDAWKGYCSANQPLRAEKMDSLNRARATPLERVAAQRSFNRLWIALSVSENSDIRQFDYLAIPVQRAVHRPISASRYSDNEKSGEEPKTHTLEYRETIVAGAKPTPARQASHQKENLGPAGCSDTVKYSHQKL